MEWNGYVQSNLLHVTKHNIVNWHKEKNKYIFYIIKQTTIKFN